MSIWGPKLYQDDIAEDVRDYFKDQLRRGKSGTEITQELIKQNQYILSDPDDAPVFWFALADTQWNLGRLMPEVKEHALALLNKGEDIRKWQSENPKQAMTRKKVLEELKQKLHSPQPPEKKLSQYRLYKCEWRTGDVFSYRLESNLAKENGLLGRYFLIQKVDEATWHPGHIIPIVYVKITKDEELPTDMEEYNQLEYVQISFSRFDPLVEEFRPKGEFLSEADFRKKIEEIKNSYEFDEYGFLPEFRVKLLNTSKNIISKNLKFIGNFPETKPPIIEFVPKNTIELPIIQWNRSNDSFETQLISAYCGHNLRQLDIYTKK